MKTTKKSTVRTAKKTNEQSDSKAAENGDLQTSSSTRAKKAPMKKDATRIKVKATVSNLKLKTSEKLGNSCESISDANLLSTEKPSFDVFSDEKRSEIMSKVRSTKNASTELRMIEEFKAQKIKGWRRNSKIFGHPDFIFPKWRIAVFVDGCFWHGHDCRNTKPKDSADYWRAKIERNQKRDAAATERLTQLGYVVVRIWECDFKKKNVERLKEKMRPILEAARLSNETTSMDEQRFNENDGKK